ncbi:MAG: inner membrane CreD family protein [Bacteroidota bacterium]
MVKRIIAIGFIYFCTVIGWSILGGSVTYRSQTQDDGIRMEVGQLWGGAQVQQAPSVHRVVTIPSKDPTKEPRVAHRAVSLMGSDVQVAMGVEHRRKGLLWYGTYTVGFEGAYRFENTTAEAATFRFRFPLASGGSVYDNFALRIDGQRLDDVPITDGAALQTLTLAPGQVARVEVAYGSQGLDDWRYDFGPQVNQVRDFSLAIRADFDDIDFPPGTLSPTQKKATDSGWDLAWTYDRLFADADIGLEVPQRLNPGPWVSRVTFFAPVSLFLFFFVLFTLSITRGVSLHPVHYFFLSAAFFSYHLLLAYLVDHMSVYAALVISAVVSMGLVISYMRRVTTPRFALVETGVTQFIYLVLFSCSFFLEGYTGLAVTVLSVITLFLAMQLTSHVDWNAMTARSQAATTAPEVSA